MTTKPDPVVEAQALIDTMRQAADANAVAWERTFRRAESAENGLRWLISNFSKPYIQHILGRLDCPAIIKRLIEEKT